MMTRQSFGGGYGINRNVAPANVLTVAQPAMKGVTVKPGFGKQMPGGPKMKAFQGAKIHRSKK